MDLLRKLMTGGDSQAAVTGEIERLLEHVQDERQTLHTLLVSFERHADELPRVHASLDEAGRRAAGLEIQIDGLAARMEDFERIRQLVDTLQTRVVSLEGGVQMAEGRVQQALAGEARVQEHREVVEQLVSLGRSTLGQIETLKQESAVLAQLDERLPRLRTEIQPLVRHEAGVNGRLDER